jgi:S1-C subfamily serine protease
MNDTPSEHPTHPPSEPDQVAASPSASITEPVPWTSGGAIPPPPPPPPPTVGGHGWSGSETSAWPPTAPLWQAAETPPRRRSRSPWMIAGAMAAILGVAFTGGYLADRLAASPSTNDSGSAVIPLSPSTSTGNGSGSTGSSTGSSDTTGAASKVTPGIVNIDVTLSGGEAAGTGMVITSTGEVLTNNHVISDETSIKVEFPSTGKQASAHVLGWDATDDVALLQIDGGGSFSTVSVGNSSTVTVGQAIVALGNALGRNGPPTVTTGTVTALNRSIVASDQGGGAQETVSHLIQIDAAIQPGDSGGPLATGSGTVIGMDTAAEVSSDRFSQGGSTIAYAIPINDALTIVRKIQAGTSTTAIHLGSTRALLGIGTPGGSGQVLVQTVQSGTGAAQAGITVGSTITALDGRAVADNTALRAVILTHKPGDTISVTWTDPAGQSHTASVTLASGPPA